MSIGTAIKKAFTIPSATKKAIKGALKKATTVPKNVKTGVKKAFTVPSAVKKAFTMATGKPLIAKKSSDKIAAQQKIISEARAKNPIADKKDIAKTDAVILNLKNQTEDAKAQAEIAKRDGDTAKYNALMATANLNTAKMDHIAAMEQQKAINENKLLAKKEIENQEEKKQVAKDNAKAKKMIAEKNAKIAKIAAKSDKSTKDQMEHKQIMDEIKKLERLIELNNNLKVQTLF